MELEQALKDGRASGALPGLHSVLVLRNGEVLANVYFEGEDEVWGTTIGNRTHGPATLHDLRSVTKSVVGLLYGIALAEGIVPPPDAPLLAAFPEHADLSTPERDAITIADALTMRMGSAWDENLPYTDPANSEIAMERAADRIRFILEQPMENAPGTAFNYSGGATTLLAELIARGSGQPIDVYARERLFDPLGLARSEWVRGIDGRPSAASGLRLTAAGLARIGQLIVTNGSHNGQQIVPADWITAMLTPHATTSQLRYGYHWWLSPQDAPTWAAAMGNGGQRMTVVKPLGVVAVIFAGNYNNPDDWEVPVSVISQYIVPALGLE
ncbi:serine hydrolase [Sulfitobacter sp. TSTF-M16]|uniref:Serine hydrolase n=2 Tax=Sulfitobacter aestuariivivens TaxID=2766981 RepID=A0A927HH01_9RHOB|nr:serine hydrolase [Sulfitobacter aestuariivivens]